MVNKNNVDQATLLQSNHAKKITDAFARVVASLHTLTTSIAAETKLTLSELGASEHLRLDGPLTPKEISGRIHLSTGATTGMLDRLERRGLIKRTPHPTDRRSVLVHYLEQQGPSVDKLSALQRRLEGRSAHFSDAEGAAIVTFLGGILEDIAAVVDASDAVSATP